MDYTLLEELFELFRNREFSAVVNRIKSSPASSFESGLRELAALDAPARPVAIQSAMGMADANLQFRLQRLRREASILPTLLGLTVLLTLFVTGLGIANVFWATRVAKVTPLNAVAPGIAEVIFEAGWGLLVVAFVFVLHRYLIRRLESRRVVWDYFVHRVMALEYMIDAEKQAEKASNQL